jgi:hypothetical protein
MAILAIHRGDGINKEMYENIGKEVNWESSPPTGVIFHAGSFDSSGNNICVAEVWESEEQWNNFLNSRLRPAMQKLNVAVPKTQIFQIQNINAFPAIDSYKVH